MSANGLIARLSLSIRAWMRRHSYSFFSSLGVLLHHKIGTLMTVLVLGIAMFLPLGLYTTLANLEGLDLRQGEWSAVTVFFQPGTDEPEVRRVLGELETEFSPKHVELISPEKGMADFRQASGFGSSLEILEENPLPWVMQVSPQQGPSEQLESAVAELNDYLQSIESVESTQFDYKWLQRLARILGLGESIALLMTLLFGVAVVVVVANTIRLDVASRAEEIEVLALVGAGNAFVRQPFLYTGLWYGLMGGVLALLLLAVTMLYLSGPMGLLLESYGAEFQLRGLGAVQMLWVLAIAAALGWTGALISVQRYLKLLKVDGRLGRH